METNNLELFRKFLNDQVIKYGQGKMSKDCIDNEEELNKVLEGLDKSGTIKSCLYKFIQVKDGKQTPIFKLVKLRFNTETNRAETIKHPRNINDLR